MPCHCRTLLPDAPDSRPKEAGALGMSIGVMLDGALARGEHCASRDFRQRRQQVKVDDTGPDADN